MSQTPVDELQARTGIEKADDETVREYVDRVGSIHDVDADTIERAHAYITEWYYADSPPADDEAFQTLLGQTSEPTEDVAATVQESSESATDATVGDQVASRTSDGPPDSAATASSETSGPEPPDADSDEASPDADGDSAAHRGDTATERLRYRAGSESTLSGFKTGIQGGEPTRLLLRFAAVIVTAPVIGWMMAQVWVPGNPFYERLRALAGEILGIASSAAIDFVAISILGLYGGLLALFFADVKKRVQGVLLLLGTVLAFGVVWYAGVFFPTVELTALNAVGFVLGFAGALAMEGGQLLSLDVRESSFQRPTLDNGTIPEFRYAALTLFGVVALVVGATLVQSVVTGELRLLGVPVVAVFLGTLYQFVQYESETNYVTLGPERSGKSMLLLGLCLELLDHSETHPEPNEYLQETLERASNLQPGRERWPIPSTAHDEVRTASFEVISGYYFPRRLEVNALDYAGQHLGRVADMLASGGEPDPDASVPGEVATRVADADTLFFILDVERLVFPEEFQETGVTDRANISWGLDHYTTILTHIDPDDVLVVATKCDILVEQGAVAPPSEYESFDGFADAVTDHLSTRPDVRELFQSTGASSVQPVYYVTERRDGEYVPKLDEDATLMPVGYDHLIQEIRSRQ